MRHIVLLGPPGAGKGTHAKLLSERLSVPHISTGDILRSRIHDGTPLGKKAKAFVESGRLVPNQLVIEMVAERLMEPDAQMGFILDGFPRTVEQAEALGEMLKTRGNALDAVLDFDTSEEVIVDRLSGRRSCPKCGTNFHIRNIPPKRSGICDQCGTLLIQRKDDEEATVRRRLQVYREQTAPLVEFYKTLGLLRVVNGNLDVEPLQAVLAQQVG